MTRRQLFQKLGVTLLVASASTRAVPVKTTKTNASKKSSSSSISQNSSPAAHFQPSKSIVSSDPTRPANMTITTSTTTAKTTTANMTATASATSKLEPINLTEVAASNSINVTMNCDDGCVKVEEETFQKVKYLKAPKWLPQFLQPPPKVIKEIQNSELLPASVVAGSFTEVIRTLLLYPIATVKTRVQMDINQEQKTNDNNNQPLRLRQRWNILERNIQRHVQEGKLYAGLVPSLLVSVPATGVYYGIRDVTKRELSKNPGVLADLLMEDVTTKVLIAAFVADIVSLAVRTPADTLAVRLQAATATKNNENNEEEQEEEMEKVFESSDWFRQSLQRLPAVILTDLPYLLSRIALRGAILSSSGSAAHNNHYPTISVTNIAQNEILTIAISMTCALLTTPFDVARTRILVDSDNDPSNGIDGGSGEGVLRTMQTISKEGNGGYRNLFAGWLERTVYLGLGRAWYDPIQILGYKGIRDAILLSEWF